MKSKIQYTAIKIVTTKNGNTNSGSGTIIKKNGNYYVVTAEHCVFGRKKEREEFKDVTISDIVVEYRYTFDDQPINIPIISITERDDIKDYIILEIEKPSIDFDFDSIVLGYFNSGKDEDCYLRGYAKAHENEPRDYKCLLKESSDDKLLWKLIGDTLNQAVDSGSEVAAGISGSGIFYINNNILFLIGIVIELRDEKGTLDDFFGIPIKCIPFLSDSIKSIENHLISNLANNFLDPLQNKLGIPNVDFILTETGVISFDSHISKREDTIKDIIDTLKDNKWLAISGTIYSGKTELLKLINRAIADTKTIFIKIQTDEPEESIIQRIQTALNGYNRDFLILDNLPQLGKDSRLLTLLTQIIEQTSIKIISGSRFLLPSKTKTYSSIIPITIPDFTIEELKEIIESYDQPKEIIDRYALFILAISNGNPAIISALCAFFQEKKWEINTDDFTRAISGSFDNELKIELNEELYTTVSDSRNRELLNRLQIHKGVFDQKIVKIVGGISPEIPELNARFLRLIGLWILSISLEQFKISPLLQIINNGSPDLPKPVIQNINIALAKNILEKKKLDQYDIQNIILYYIRADRPNEAGYFYIKCMTVAIDNIEYIKNSFLSYYWIDLPLPEEMDIRLKSQIRFFQAHFLRISNKDVSYVLNDLEKIQVMMPEKGVDSFLVNSTLGTMYSNPMDLAPKSFGYLLEAYKSSKTLDPDILDQIDKSRNNIEMLWFMFSQIVSQSDINGWLVVLNDTIDTRALEELESSEMYKATTFFFYKRFKENAIREIEKDQNCDSIQTLLLYLLDKLKTYKLEETKLQLICLVIQLYDLSGNKHKAFDFFVKELNSFEKIENKGILYFAIITVLLFEDKEKVEKFLTNEVESVLIDTLKIKSGLSVVLDGLCSLISYYKDIDVKKSLYYTQLAYDYSIQDEKQFEIISQSLVAGEYAVALWINDQKEQSIEILDIGFRKLLSVISDDEKYKVLIIKYGILIRYIALNDKKDEYEYEYVVPHIGMFFLNPNPDRLIEVYDPIRDFFNSHFMFDIHKISKNHEKTKYWAIYSYKMGQSITKNPYTILMLYFIPYLIEEKLYEDVINILYRDNEEIERVKKGESQYLDIMRRLQPERDFSNEKIPNRNITTDEEVLNIYIIPMLIDALSYYQENEDNKCLYEIVKILKRHLDYCIDRSVIGECVEIIDVFIKQEGVIDYTVYQKNKSNTLQCIVYLLGSVSLDVKHSFELQMKSIVYIDELFKLYENEKEFLLYPFFRNFWLRRISNCPSEFEGYQHLQNKGIQVIDNGNGKKLNRLFKVLSNHISINLNSSQEDWLEL